MKIIQFHWNSIGLNDIVTLSHSSAHKTDLMPPTKKSSWAQCVYSIHLCYVVYNVEIIRRKLEKDERIVDWTKKGRKKLPIISL